MLYGTPVLFRFLSALSEFETLGYLSVLVSL